MKGEWIADFRPAKQLPMQGVMLYFSGSGVQIFSLGMIFMLLTGPISAVLNIFNGMFPPSLPSFRSCFLHSRERSSNGSFRSASTYPSAHRCKEEQGCSHSAKLPPAHRPNDRLCRMSGFSVSWILPVQYQTDDQSLLRPVQMLNDGYITYRDLRLAAVREPE
jgi:hypothetical protein